MGDELVECHAGFMYPERPTALRWEGQRLEVAAVLAEWRTPEGLGFRVRTVNGGRFELLYNETTDEWQVHPD